MKTTDDLSSDRLLGSDRISYVGEITPKLRFITRGQGQRILQQAWAITTYCDGLAIEQSVKWEDVPLEDET